MVDFKGKVPKKKEETFTPESPESKEKMEGPKLSAAELDALGGQQFGGQAPMLHELKVGEIRGVFTYVGSNEIDPGSGKLVTSHTAHDDSGQLYRMPINAAFVLAMAQAGLSPRDRFAIRRDADFIKRRGAGQGKPFPAFSVIVVERAEQ